MDGMEKTQNKLPKGARIALMVCGGIGLAVLFAFVFGIFVRLLWNWLMPGLFGLATITYWQACGIVLLARLIFGSHDLGASDGHGRKKAKHAHACGEDGRANGRHYRAWWESEGREAFQSYVENLGEAPPDNDGEGE